jgi:lysophospholipase L1-like esterase
MPSGGSRRPLLALLAAALAACGGSPSIAPATTSSGATASPLTSPVTGALRYVALGDSYTIGTSVGIDARWPNQLVAALGTDEPTLQLVANLGVNGYTSRDVRDDELPRLDALEPGFVSLLVGVNDVVQGVPEATFRQNVDTILDDLVARVGAERILIVTTPDYTVTPAGGDYGDPAQQSAGIQRNNAILTELAERRGILVVDIYDLSLEAANDRSLVADDGLHPSGRQYALWVERILPTVETMLGR